MGMTADSLILSFIVVDGLDLIPDCPEEDSKR